MSSELVQDQEVITDIFNRMSEVISRGEYPNIHSVLVSINGKQVFEQYYDGMDEVYGKNVGKVKVEKDYIHDVRSISKTIVATCIGIAIDQGKIKSVHQNIFDFFPNHQELKTGARSKLTIEHLLTMTSGMVWNEPLPATDPSNSEIQMINSPDPIGFVMNTPLDIEAGLQWRYNGGNTQMLAAIIEHVCNMPIDKFAALHIFDPLEISNYEWINCHGANLPAAASGLRLKSRDLLKLGQLYLNRGQWNNKQVLPENWTIDSLKPHISRSATEAYGYSFWLWTDTISDKNYSFSAAAGNGDQRIYIEESKNLIVVVTAGNYDNWDITNNSYMLMKEFILPAIK